MAGLFAFCAAFFLSPVSAQPVDDSGIAGTIGQRGALPTISKFANRSFGSAGLATRGAKEAQICKDVAPSVVLILVKDGIGSGTLVLAQETPVSQQLS